jgi:hypothetical protein
MSDSMSKPVVNTSMIRAMEETPYIMPNTLAILAGDRSRAVRTTCLIISVLSEVEDVIVMIQRRMIKF